MPPLHLSSTFAFEDLERPGRYDYSRTGNPSRDVLAGALADLEGGAGAVVVASGMAAVDLVLHLVPPGGRVVAPHDCYGGTHRLLRARAGRGAFEVAFVDQRDAAALARCLSGGADLVWIETPSNPLLRVVDIASVCAQAHAAGAVAAVDNTFLSPALQRPLALGADVVVHSTTKYLNGHSDVVGGAAVAADPAVVDELAWWANCLGTSGAPFDAYLTLRGLRTLDARMRVHELNARRVVEALVDAPGVRQVHYPGLEHHPGHDVALHQQDGFGAMVAFEMEGGKTAVRSFVRRLRWFTLAESLGGVESLVCHPATMTHAAMDAEARRVAGIGDGLVRLSVGIEDSRDLIEDLRAALDGAVGCRGTAPP